MILIWSFKKNYMTKSKKSSKKSKLKTINWLMILQSGKNCKTIIKNKKIWRKELRRQRSKSSTLTSKSNSLRTQSHRSVKSVKSSHKKLLMLRPKMKSLRTTSKFRKKRMQSASLRSFSAIKVLPSRILLQTKNSSKPITTIYPTNSMAKKLNMIHSSKKRLRQRRY